MDVTKTNFKSEFEEFCKNVENACFISFDAEFTGLLSGYNYKHRLFDSNEERYNVLRPEASKMIMTQVGLTVFQYNSPKDTYTGRPYTFHLCPQKFGKIDQTFMFQASSVDFLCRNKFDFNKFLYDGIPYLSRVEEEEVKTKILDGTMLNELMENLTVDDEKYIQNICSEVSKWLSITNKKFNDTLYFDVESPILRFILHYELRSRFPTILTNNSLGLSEQLVVYRNKDVEGAKSMSEYTLKENLSKHAMSFSNLLEILKYYRRPIIGHNLFMDLILLHSQFIGPLPKKYSDFKKAINLYFTEIYDTKYISHDLVKQLSYDEQWKSNGLQDLYEYFYNGKCKKMQVRLNRVELSKEFSDNQSYHEAGWDSYCAGYCFIRLGHWRACENIGTYTYISPGTMIAAMEPYRNKINVIRGAVPYMFLEGNDPPTHRPRWLHIKATSAVLDTSQVTRMLSNYGSVDVKPHGKRAVLVAASSSFVAEKIVKRMRDCQEYRVSTYNIYRHSTLSHVFAHVTILGGAILTGSLMLYILRRN